MSTNQTLLNYYSFGTCIIWAVLSYVYVLDVAVFLESHHFAKNLLWCVFLVVALYWGIFIRQSRPYDFGITAIVLVSILAYAYTIEIAVYLEENVAFKNILWIIGFLSAAVFVYPLSREPS